MSNPSPFWDLLQKSGFSYSRARAQERQEEPPELSQQIKEYYETVRQVEEVRHLNKKEVAAMAGKRFIRLHPDTAFIADPETVKTYNMLCTYFAGMPQANISLKKGLCLLGDVGTGKTTALSLFAQPAHPYRINNGYTCKANIKELTRYYSTGGFENVSRYFDTPVLFLDDIGREIEVSYYGKFWLFPEILNHRYTRRLTTHITTNFMDITFFAERYGDYIADRMREMFNFIVQEGGSKR